MCDQIGHRREDCRFKDTNLRKCYGCGQMATHTKANCSVMEAASTNGTVGTRKRSSNNNNNSNSNKQGKSNSVQKKVYLRCNKAKKLRKKKMGGKNGNYKRRYFEKKNQANIAESNKEEVEEMNSKNTEETIDTNEIISGDHRQQMRARTWIAIAVTTAIVMIFKRILWR